jgi:hypothetical protein
LTSRSCSSDSSIEAPQRQQSAIISQIRTDIGARHSGQAQKMASPSSQISPALRALPFETAAWPLALPLRVGNGSLEFKSNIGNTLRGDVGTGGVSGVGTSSGKKSKPNSLGPKLCWSSLS